MQSSIDTFLRDVEAGIRSLSIESALATWDATTTGTEEALARSIAAESNLRRFLSSRDRFASIKDYLDRSDLDPLQRRQLALLELDHIPNQLPQDVIDDLVQRAKRIELEFSRFRARIDGREVTDNEIIAILRNELDGAKRKAAWEASKQIAPRIADELLELVRRRNESAQSIGYRDYYQMQLALQEIDEAWLLALFDELGQRTERPFREAKGRVDAELAERFGISPENLETWHYADPFFQEPPLSGQLGIEPHFRGRDLLAIARAFFAGIGLPVDDVLERSDLHERPGKDQHAYCIDVDREGDVRILCNLQDDDRWMGILLHELGHAAYDKFISPSLPWLLRQPAHIAVTEAIALFMDRLLYDIDWLGSAAAILPDDPAELARKASRVGRFEMLLMARWVLVMTHFERALYERPERQRLDDLWWDLVERYQIVHRPPDRNAPDWAAKIHLTVAPVYYHNYQLGELIASQIGAAFRRKVLDGKKPRGYVGRAELGAYLRDEIFVPGSRLHWNETIERATGSELSIEPFIAEFVVA